SLVLLDLRQVLLRDRKVHIEGTDLIDLDQTCVVRFDDVSLVNQELASSPGQRRMNGTVSKLYLRIFNRRLISATSCFYRTRIAMELVVLFFGYQPVCIKLLGAVDLSSCILFLGQVPCQIRFRLLKGRLIGARIDCEEEISFSHVLTFLEIDALQLPIHSR